MNAVFILSGLGIFSLLAEVINFRKLLYPLVVLGLITAAVVVAMDWNTSQYYYNDMLLFDNNAIAFSALISVVAMLWIIMSKDYFYNNTHITDHFALVLFALVGAVFMVSYYNMVMLFLGIEILSISLYILAGSRMKDILSNEAAFKYFLMGSFATGFLLFGITLIYGATGSFNLTEISEAITSGKLEFGVMLYMGMFLMLIGLGFKVSAAPFHFWAPDVYQGSPTVVTAFMSTIVKIAAFAALFRLFSFCFTSIASTWLNVIQVLAVLTLLISNITAVFQKNIKRLLAYSSIAHAGYLFITLLSLNETAANVVFYYVAAYSIATIGAFCVLHIVSGEDEQVTASAFNGLVKRNPLLALVMTISLLSLAGIPPLAGFFAKYMIFTQALNQGYLAIVLLAVGTSLIGVFYYFQIIIAMFTQEGAYTPIFTTIPVRILMAVLVVLNLLLGLFPDVLNF